MESAGLTLVNNIGNIYMKDVEFSYKSRQQDMVLKKFSFSIRRGEIVSIVGPSGSGKTTIVKLLKRFYNIDSGYNFKRNFNL